MKVKKTWSVKWLIVLFVMIGVFGLSGCSGQEDQETVGRYLRSDRGEHLLIDGELPIRIYGRSGGDKMFEGLETGDKILVVHGLVRETYPAQAEVYDCVKLDDGTWNDIPDTIIDSLTELGWLMSGEGETDR